MCENRERLIGYVYDECDVAERREIEEHLQSCHTCRQEIRGLRSVRQDLLAWDVPAHEPVWRPAAETRPAPAWRGVPAWALAAAACATLAIGAAGGAATSALLTTPTPVMADAQPAAPSAVTASAPSPADIAAIESRVIERMRAELDTRVREVSLGAARVGAEPGPDTADLARRMNMLTMRQNELYDRVLEFASETERIQAKQSAFERSNRMLVNYMQVGNPTLGGQ